ncbi:outer membrane protein assembly factor BamD [Conchiformibius kuhniae]|uniref:Outer membrane protein assembly factor BamD n=1 Tax=Conchiformibius kuhniae TaxID=211502 RepID=A0ABD8B7V6_9NEIS|nr:outer membrane protein assembly factor BamD [Conchiformibius kuhniae]
MKQPLSALLLAALLLSACAGTDQSKISKDARQTQNWQTEQLYSEARKELDAGNYSRAATLYEILRSRQPEGRYVEQALMEEAYAHYKNEEPVKALASLERFEKHFPASIHTDYALYLRGLVQFDEDTSFLNKLSAQDWSDRDPQANRDTYKTFETLVKRFPNSKYAPEARKRMTRLVEALGGHEIAIARYYAKRGAHLAANNRAQRIVQQFQNTSYPEEALAIMVFTYEKMGKTQLADDARRVLQTNYPNSSYLQKAWVADDMPWWRYWK